HNFHAAFAKEIDQCAVHDGGAHLSFNIVPNKRQIFIGEPFSPSRIARDKDWDVIDKAESGFERAASIKSGGLLRPDGKIIYHQFRRGIFQLGDNLFAGGFLLEWKKCAEWILILHVWRVGIPDAAPLHHGAREPDLFAEKLFAICGRKNS